MRMFRSLQFIQDFLVGLGVADPIEKGLSLFKAFSLAVWMIVDHLQWMHKVGYIKLEAEKRLSEIHSKAWFFGLLSGVVLSGYKLQALYKKKTDDKKKFEEKQFKLTQGIVKNSVDLVIPMARLKWVDASDGVVGLAGTVTSVIGILDTWPKKK
ncbi:peroxisomal biogenesis factor 11 [Gorgonomyces haynaldii]|nr:peroxisomal biogenesis factor 11 [Gorgonomyces haynaldii]